MTKWEYMYVYPPSSYISKPSELLIWPAGIVDLSWAENEYQVQIDLDDGIAYLNIPKAVRVDFGPAMIRFLGESGWEAIGFDEYHMWFKRPIEG